MRREIVTAWALVYLLIIAWLVLLFALAWSL